MNRWVTDSNLPIRYYVGRGVEELLLKSSVITRAYYNVAPKFYEWKYRRKTANLDEKLIIFKLIEVNPSKIEYISGRSSLTTGPSRRKNIGTVLNGDWDLNPRRHIEKEGNFVYQALSDHFERGVPWEETNLYHWAIEQINKGEQWHNCRTRSDVNKRFDKIEKLYLSIRDEGYKTQKEISGQSIDFVNSYLSEVSVDVGRNGDFFLVDGRHRLAIAKILDIDQIPVFPIVRHHKWMEHRKRLCEKTKVLQDRPHHPDLNDIF